MAESSERKRRVRNPDGGVVYLEMYNPYVNEDDRTPLIETTPVVFPVDIIEKAQKLEKMMCLVKFVCICDIFMSVYYFYYNFFLGLVLAITSTSGYMATIYYRRSLMCAYLFYQYLQVGARMGNFILFVVTVSDTSTTVVVNNTNALTTGEKTEVGLLLGFLMFSQMAICCYIQKFYNLLPSGQDRERIQRVAV
jgi:hypothetical protein|tara:strand:- start:226 stop:807 length:582 start_codon:yes stop_codon:yes gene_type:complete